MNTNDKGVGKSFSKLEWLGILLFPFLLCIWLFLDNSLPYWDGASHVLDSIRYRELFRHPNIFSTMWWNDLLTVNYCYPPQLHCIFGLTKLVTGKGILGEKFLFVLFSFILSFSSYKLAYSLFESKLASFGTLVALNSFPIVMDLSHTPYLDYPYLALYCLAMLSLVLWRKDKSWQMTVLLGISIGFAASSKQVASYFLIFPCLFLLGLEISKKQWKNALKLLSSGAIAALFLFVWLIPNIEEIVKFTHRPCPFAEEPTFSTVFFTNLSGYFSQLICSMSPMLLILFALGMLIKPRSNIKSLWLIVLSFLGICLLCTISYNNPEQRYMIPAFLYFALVIGHLLKCIDESKFRGKSVLLSLLIGAALVQFLTYSFTPYPVSSPKFLAKIPEALKIKNEDEFTALSSPTPPGDIWGQERILDKIAKSENGRPVYLCVIPNDHHYNVHTFNLISSIKEIPVRATTTRKWTLKGDDIKFDKKQLNYYQWFLLVSKEYSNQKKRNLNPGSGFNQELPKDLLSYRALDLMISEIKKIANLEYTIELPNGSRLELYRNNN